MAAGKKSRRSNQDTAGGQDVNPSVTDPAPTAPPMTGAALPAQASVDDEVKKRAEEEKERVNNSRPAQLKEAAEEKVAREQAAREGCVLVASGLNGGERVVTCNLFSVERTEEAGARLTITAGDPGAGQGADEGKAFDLEGVEDLDDPAAFPVTLNGEETTLNDLRRFDKITLFGDPPERLEATR